MPDLWDISDGHWLWTGPVYPSGRPRYIGAQAGTAARARWTETYGDILPTGSQLQRLCDALPCVRPDHHAIRGPRRLWARLRRPVKELDLLEVALDKRVSEGESSLRYLGGTFEAPAAEVARLALAYEVDVLAILAAWSLLAIPESRATGEAINAPGASFPSGANFLTKCPW